MTLWQVDDMTIEKGHAVEDTARNGIRDWQQGTDWARLDAAYNINENNLEKSLVVGRLKNWTGFGSLSFHWIKASRFIFFYSFTWLTHL